MTFSTDAIVLKITKTGESDRLLTLLTRDRGILKAFAKAADRPKNKLHSATNLFCYGRFTFYEGVKSTKVEECDLNETFFGLQQDIAKLALAQYFNELMIESAPIETEANEYLRLLLNSLYFLANDKKNIHILKSLFELRLASLINDITGELYCNNCKGAGTKCYPLEVITAMRHIVFSEFDKLYSLSVSVSSIHLLEAVAEKYLSAVLRKKFRTLDFYKSITQ